jgi:hypothetical protein
MGPARLETGPECAVATHPGWEVGGEDTEAPASAQSLPGHGTAGFGFVYQQLSQ